MSRVFVQTKKRQKTAAIVLGVLLLFAVLFSAWFPAFEAGHHCTGEDCPICDCIVLCGKITQKIGAGVVIGLMLWLAAVKAGPVVCCGLEKCVPLTLIRLKVRLDD